MRLSDTLTRGPADLPEPPGPVRIYSCGPTVYQRIHVGNAVPFVFAMWLRRWLQHTGYEVQLAINITDVNDKIYEAAPGKSAELARNATEWYLEDTSGLGLGRPDFEPRATGTIPEQVAMIEQLIDAGFAYEVDGDVYYRVSRFPEYGRLSGQRPDKVEEQEPNPRKEDPRDFALWKANKPGEDTSWDSPWGKGRPGWHIECSAMSEKHLGTEFEVHGGGLDLVFPHHENELAQSRALGHRYAKIWMHNGLLRFGGAEMHKSLGNTSRFRTRSRRGGGRRCSSSTRPATGASRSTSRTRRSGRRRRGQRASATSFGRRRSRRPKAPGSALPRLSTTTSTRPRRSRSCTSGGTTTCSAGRSRSSGSSRSPSCPRRRRRWSSSRASGRGRERRSASTMPTSCAGGSRRPAGSSATRTPSSSSSPGRDARAGLRPPPCAGGAPGAARGPRALGHRARARGRAVVARERQARPREAGAGAERGGRHPGPPGRARLGRAVQVRRRARAR